LSFYIAWASHCDNTPWHGWVIGYNETTLQQSGVFSTTPDGIDGGIWQGSTPLKKAPEMPLARL
jgi:hypothetical protein